MKIQPCDNGKALTSTKTPASQPASTDGTSFEEVLGGAVKGNPIATTTAPQVQSIQRPPMVMDQPRAGIETVATKVEACLDALEAYRSALADSRTTLREVGPLLLSLDTASQSLDEQMSGLPEDHALREIGDQTRALIQTERTRFDGGLYI